MNWDWQSIAYAEALIIVVSTPIAVWALFRLRMLQSHALADPLTGLANRRALDNILKYEIQRSKRYESTFSLLFIDLDRFKRVNDLKGHDEGDRLLVSIADVLRDNTRESDLAVRFGGDEFVIILVETDLDGATNVAEKVRADIEQLTSGNNQGVTASIGIATYPTENSRGDSSSLIRRADQRTYVAKKQGGNAVITAHTTGEERL